MAFRFRGVIVHNGGEYSDARMWFVRASRDEVEAVITAAITAKSVS